MHSVIPFPFFLEFNQIHSSADFVTLLNEIEILKKVSCVYNATIYLNMLPPKEKQKLPPNFRALDITISFLDYFMYSNLGVQRNKFILVFDFWCPYSSIWKIFILSYL